MRISDWSSDVCSSDLQRGLAVGFTTAAALVSEMMEARDERRLLRFQKQMAAYKLLIIDELGFVQLSKTVAELLFELISQRYERGPTQIGSAWCRERVCQSV